MNIAIYKPLKKVYFHDDSEDNAAWSYEIAHVAKILAKNGHDVYMISESDLNDNPRIEGIGQGSIESTYDRIIIWSGTFKDDVNGEAIIATLRKQTPRLDFMLTDLRLVPQDKELYKLFDNVYTQATRNIASVPVENQIYAGVAEFLPFGHEYKQTVEQAMENKRVDYYFGGTERGRLMDFLEYVWRPECLITTKSAFLKVENRVNRKEYMALLDATKYSIVIADVDYNDNYFITPRPYEYYMHDIICFVDNKFDRDGHIIPLDSWLRVNNFKELKEKMGMIDSMPELHQQWLMWQREQMTPDLIDGSYVYNLIK